MSLMKILLPAGLSIFLLGSANRDATVLLRAAEHIRNPQVSYEAVIKITDQKNGKDDVRTYRVKSKDQTTSLIEYLTPVSDSGTKVLVVGNDMWVAMEKVANPIRIAPKQKLVGNAAYGDITSINYEDSYDASFKSEDTVDGKASYILALTAKPGKSVSYERIDYWIEKVSKRPLKATYMTSSGKVMREGFFTGYKEVLGVERPLVLILKDILDRNLTTKIEFVEAKEKKFPNGIFQKSSLK
jgi:outer membrane lipoprotein-sorting protein